MSIANQPIATNGRQTRSSLRNQNKSPSPLPGTDNYELYCTLTDHEDPSFIAQTTKDSRESSNERGSDLDTSQSSIIVAPPSEQNNTPTADSVFESETDESKSAPKKTRKRNLQSPHNSNKSNILTSTIGDQISNDDKPLLITNEPIDNPPKIKPIIRSYTRKRKIIASLPETQNQYEDKQSTDLAALTVPSSHNKIRTDISKNFDATTLSKSNQTQFSNYSVDVNLIAGVPDHEYTHLNKFRKKLWDDQEIHSDSSQDNKFVKVSGDNHAEISTSETDKPSVKIVISKKKGSIFKSRAFVTDQGMNIFNFRFNIRATPFPFVIQNASIIHFGASSQHRVCKLSFFRFFDIPF